MSGFLEGPGPVGFAHRGYSPAGAENSMSAFAAAVALGYRYVETDARVTSDGVALAFHDDRLDRVTDRAGRVVDLPWSEVSRARIRGTDPIPRLDALLGEWPELRVNIDIKSGVALSATLAAVRRTAAQDRVCLAAFSDARLHRIRALAGPDVCTALGPGEVARLATAARSPTGIGVRLAAGIDGKCVQVPPRLGRVSVVTADFVRVAHRRGLVVHVWTVNRRAEMTRLLDLGVDGIMTDEADTLRDVLRERGAWFG